MKLTMIDDFILRDRIATAVLPLYSYDPDVNPDEWAKDIADAVILELGLKSVDGPLKGTPVHRFVTEWLPDE